MNRQRLKQCRQQCPGAPDGCQFSDDAWLREAAADDRLLRVAIRHRRGNKGDSPTGKTIYVAQY
jgi:hypothetical protein